MQYNFTKKIPLHVRMSWFLQIELKATERKRKDSKCHFYQFVLLLTDIMEIEINVVDIFPETGS